LYAFRSVHFLLKTSKPIMTRKSLTELTADIQEIIAGTEKYTDLKVACDHFFTTGKSIQKRMLELIEKGALPEVESVFLLQEGENYYLIHHKNSPVPDYKAISAETNFTLFMSANFGS